MERSTLRVLVVDDSESVRRAICQLLSSQAEIEVVGEAVDGDARLAESGVFYFWQFVQ